MSSCCRRRQIIWLRLVAMTLGFVSEKKKLNIFERQMSPSPWHLGMFQREKIKFSERQYGSSPWHLGMYQREKKIKFSERQYGSSSWHLSMFQREKIKYIRKLRQCRKIFLFMFVNICSLQQKMLFTTL